MPSTNIDYRGFVATTKLSMGRDRLHRRAEVKHYVGLADYQRQQAPFDISGNAKSGNYCLKRLPYVDLMKIERLVYKYEYNY